MINFKAVKGSSSGEERSAAYQPGLLLLLAGAAAVTVLFAAITCVAYTLQHQASFKLTQHNINTVMGNKELDRNTTVKVLFQVFKFVIFLLLQKQRKNI